MFRGAGWNVIKVILGSKWDELLAADKDGVLLNKLNTTVDGEFQRYSTESGDYIRDHFFGPDPRLRADGRPPQRRGPRQPAPRRPRLPQAVRRLQGGHREPRLRARRRRSSARRSRAGRWAPTSKGRNATHQIKKMNKEQLLRLRDRLYLHDEIPESALDGDAAPYFRPAEDSIEYQYMMERRRALGGSIPKRVVRYRKPAPLPDDAAFAELRKGSGGQAVSTTMGFTRLLRNMSRDAEFGKYVVPIIPDEGRTFGMDSLFPQLKIYASQGQLYEPVDHDLLLSYAESKTGQILEEGITEAGSTASFIAAGTAYATLATPTVPFYTFYSMFGFQRVGDLIWQAADSRTRGFLLGATAGRTTLLGEGLQHQDGHSLVLASTVPACQAYDPAFAFEVATIVQQGLQRMYGDGGPDAPSPDVFYYLTLYNENYPMPPMPEHVSAERRDARAVPVVGAPRGPGRGGHAAVLRLGPGRRPGGRRGAGRRTGTSASSCGRRRRTRRCARRRCGVERWNRLHPSQEPRVPLVAELLGDGSGRCPADRQPDRRRHRLHEDRPRADRPLRPGPPVRAARHRRDGPQRHPRGAAPPLRDRHRPRRRRRAQRPRRRRLGRRRRRRQGDRPLRHRPRPPRPARPCQAAFAPVRRRTRQLRRGAWRQRHCLR